ncbi:Uncharacterised protein [Suttonella ornithocola]|uniref:Uncharacterized protein n=1 Tax=Suttonella ornithocola TaxID=279832 RepID=A0A380N1U2_9GAMM|nr:Uncharacterised protein [Suttonella ornithocola]
MVMPLPRGQERYAVCKKCGSHYSLGSSDVIIPIPRKCPQCGCNEIYIQIKYVNLSFKILNIFQRIFKN